jgi:hypothetical protein
MGTSTGLSRKLGLCIACWYALSVLHVGMRSVYCMWVCAQCIARGYALRLRKLWSGYAPDLEFFGRMLVACHVALGWGVWRQLLSRFVVSSMGFLRFVCVCVVV